MQSSSSTPETAAPAAGSATPEAVAPAAGSATGACAPGSEGGGRVVVLLLGCAAVSLLCYVLLLAVVKELQTAEPSYAGEVLPWAQRLTRETMAKRHDVASLRFVGLLLILFVAYAAALRATAGPSSGRLAAVALAAGGAFLGVQLLQPAMLSTDVYSYVLYGRILAVHGGDPYVKLPYRSIDDPYLPLAYDLPWPSWYGPLWTLISAGLALVGGERVGLTVLLFRGLAALGVLAAGGLIWLVARRIDPSRAVQGVVFFCWNPLVVLESGMSGHNDSLMVALLLAGVWIFVGGRPALATLPFALSALVKFLTGVVAGLFAWLALRQARSWRERLRYLALSALVGGLAVGACVGLVRGAASPPALQVASASSFYQNNLGELAFRALRVQFGEDPESARTPVHFIAWWAQVEQSTRMRAAPERAARGRERYEGGETLLVISPGPRGWVRAWDPGSGESGYVEEVSLARRERPESANLDPRVWEQERNPVANPPAQRANAVLRGATWTLFGLLLLLALWRARGPREAAVWSTVLVLGSYWLVATETWPWYVTWALALGALAPASRPAVLAAVLSAAVLSLYVTIGYERTDLHWLYTFRSLPAFALPLALCFGVWAARWVVVGLTREEEPAQELAARRDGEPA